ncbi:MAG TPA: urease accessory UreF family protein [Verrucomicrobiae bacterium]|nr:urease accessory UreF family protein [Verrucomicrobiae bacterium]
MKHDDDTNHWLLLQLADSAFPTGGFAHSGGLEAAWQHGEICEAADLVSYLETNLWQIASSSVPFVRAGHTAPAQILEWNLHCDAFLSNHVANRASRLQGRAFLNSATRIFAVEIGLETHSDPCHFAPVFGAVTRSLSLSRSMAEQVFFFQSLRSLVAAAVRLGIVGPMEAQAIQYRFSARSREILDSVKDHSVNDAVMTAPLSEIWQGSHDRLYSRLFQT